MEFTVSKTSLIETLKKNKTEHTDAYQKAIIKYRDKALEWFTQNIEIVRNGGQIEHYLRIPVPEEHTEDFDRAIEGLEWHSGDEINLTESQFEQLVRNKWGWHNTFTANTSSYLAS